MEAWLLKLAISIAAGLVADRLAGVATGPCLPSFPVVVCAHWAGVSAALKVLVGFVDPRRAPTLLARSQEPAAPVPAATPEPEGEPDEPPQPAGDSG